MEFSVAEQLAVLAIRPSGGWAISGDRLGTVLAAGAIGELIVGGHIDVVDGVVRTGTSAPTAFLEDIQAKIEGQPVEDKKMLADSGGKTTLTAVYRRLADRSLVEQETGWFRRWRFTPESLDSAGAKNAADAGPAQNNPADELASALREALATRTLEPREQMVAQLLDAARLLTWLKLARAEQDGAREALRPRPWIAELLQRRLATQSFRL